MMDDKKQTRKWLTIGFWGPVVGLVGGLLGIIGGGASLLDRYFPPSLAVEDILPVFVYGEKIEDIGSDKIQWKLRGVYFIVKVRSSGRSVSVSGIEVDGKRYLTFNEWLGYYSRSGESLVELGKEFENSKAFYQVSFTGWMTDSPGPIRLNPHEETLIRFTIIDPEERYRGRLIDENYVGSETMRKHPSIRRYHPEWSDFVELRSNGTAASLRDELRSELLRIGIVVAGARQWIPASKIRPAKNIRIEEWNDKPLPYLLGDQYN